MTFHLINEGVCTRVKLYGEDVRQTLLLNGYSETSRDEAKWIFLNTCSFLKSKEDYFLSFINKINKTLLPHQTLCIIGCLPSVNKEAIFKINSQIVLFNRKLDDISTYFKLDKVLTKLSSELDEILDPKKKVIYYINKYICHSKHIDFRLRKHKVFHIQISVGCLGKCAYCSERQVVKLKSRHVDDIIDAIYDGLKRGYKLFSLNADDVSAYGKDINSSIEVLLERVLSIDETFYLCLPEFNPQGLSPKVISLLSNKKVLYITVPIQSGSNSVLNSMKRPYMIDDVLNNIKKIKKNNKGIKINTHVIVGFPGETEDDFNRTRKIIAKGYFDRLKIFKYSDRPNTESLYMTNKITDQVKEKRKTILRKAIIKNAIKHMSLSDFLLNLEII